MFGNTNKCNSPLEGAFDNLMTSRTKQNASQHFDRYIPRKSGSPASTTSSVWRKPTGIKIIEGDDIPAFGSSRRARTKKGKKTENASRDKSKKKRSRSVVSATQSTASQTKPSVTMSNQMQQNIGRDLHVDTRHEETNDTLTQTLSPKRSKTPISPIMMHCIRQVSTEIVQERKEEQKRLSSLASTSMDDSNSTVKNNTEDDLCMDWDDTFNLELGDWGGGLSSMALESGTLPRSMSKDILVKNEWYSDKFETSIDEQWETLLTCLGFTCIYKPETKLGDFDFFVVELDSFVLHQGSNPSSEDKKRFMECSKILQKRIVMFYGAHNAPLGLGKTNKGGTISFMPNETIEMMHLLYVCPQCGIADIMCQQQRINHKRCCNCDVHMNGFTHDKIIQALHHVRTMHTGVTLPSREQYCFKDHFYI
ncbi:MAG: hypothetical protein ACTSUE_18835 [Promethearchaeota archaeon]